MMMVQVNISKEGGIVEAASIICEAVVGGDMVGFQGPLGAGKTTLIKEVVRQLGSPAQVTSPTYVLQHLYHSAGLTIEHWDLYRISGEIDELSIPAPTAHIRLIEWPEKMALALDFLVTIELPTRDLTILKY